MLTLLSPSKSQDFSKEKPLSVFTQSAFHKESLELINSLRKLKVPEIMELMDLSKSLAELNFNRYKEFTLPFNLDNAKQAILSFTGDVYTDIDVDNYTQDDFNFANHHLRIISGLYGLLKPLDLIQPYRLEMGIKLSGEWGKDLYAFWDGKITNLLNQELENHKIKALINLASNEYFSAVKPKLLKAEIITPVFKEFKNGKYQVIAIFAKRARGGMANYIIQNKIDNIEALKDFNIGGYNFDSKLSSEKELVFTRIMK
jgi:cytoplasmic iron level regulating protein YaaA (DUF328/UPF0246 family)